MSEFLAILSPMNCDHMLVKVGKELAQKIEFISYKSPNALYLPVSKVEKGDCVAITEILAM